jgi:N-methylhydantoinase A/oxoprolinase/acetone carboxylase beta subunit
MTSETAPPVRIAVDVGGTFTDLQILDTRSGAITNLKTPTTPEDPSLGLMSGIREAAARDGFAFADIGYLLHGTTIATNAVLERRLPRGALIATAGFEDVLEIGRHYRREIYALNPQVPPALVPRDCRIGVPERIRADGSIETALTGEALDALAARLDRLDVETVALCLLNAYVNPEHEIAIADYLARTRPSLRVSPSSALNAEIREYERTSTTVLNALLMPVVAGYLDKLDRRMQAEGCLPRLLLVQSNGGVCSAATAAREPVRLLLSGPSGGAAACALISQALGEANVVGVDMGGTSFDVSVVRDGRVNLIAQGEIDRLPVRLPMVEMRTIGAGGGSIATVRAGGRLTVGPESAGSRPGPACYSRGGTEPTVTDANLALGRLDGEGFLGGGMRLDLDKARAAIGAHVAQALGLAVEPAAEGLLAVTNASLGGAIRLSLFEKGLDPRDFAMIAFGGAAGLHAMAVAEELGIRRVVFPESASTLSAYGILHSNLAHDVVRSKVLAASEDNLRALAAMAESLHAEATARLDADRVPAEDRQIELKADMRYTGQAFELMISADAPAASASFDRTELDSLVESFHETHRQRFSYANPGAAVEIVSLRVSAIGRLPIDGGAVALETAASEPPRLRKVWTSGGWREIAVWRRGAIGPGAEIAGPALIEEAYTTVLLADGWRCRRHEGGHLLAERVRQ